MHSNIEVTKKMVEYAKKHGLLVPVVYTNTNRWGTGKKTLAWRVSGHAFGVKFASALRTSRLEKLLFPDTSAKPDIHYPNYQWKSRASVCTKHPGIVWHHAAGYGTPLAINQIHLNIGDRGIAYHFYVERDGTISAGRPLGTWGAHCFAHNDWIGVCAEGNYDTNRVMPAAQKKSLIALHNWLHKKYGGIPDKKHKDMPQNATACPGKWFPFSDIT